MGVLVMVEFQFLPTCGGMAFFAILAVASIMHIVKLMARKARYRCFKIVFADMAARTFGFTVLTGERKLGLLMIVLDFAPMVLIVAACALVVDLAHDLLLMRRFLGMTAFATLGGFPVLLSTLVAVRASDFRMLST